MKQDNVVDPSLPDLAALGIEPIAVETELRRRTDRDGKAS
jgi:hypothetical protein